jgi:hypothetical protein
MAFTELSHSFFFHLLLQTSSKSGVKNVKTWPDLHLCHTEVNYTFLECTAVRLAQAARSWMFPLFFVVLASFSPVHSHLYVIASYSSIVFLVSVCPLSLLPCTCLYSFECLLTKQSTVNRILPH